MLQITPIIQQRMTTLDEGPELAGFFFHEEVNPAVEELVAKGLSAAESAEAARRSYAILEALADWHPVEAEPAMRALVEELGWSAGQVFGILRVAVTGSKVSPPLFESMEIIGRAKCLERLRKAIKMLEES
jgi:glutamyl-tRNA synthetase